VTNRHAGMLGLGLMGACSRGGSAGNFALGGEAVIASPAIGGGQVVVVRAAVAGDRAIRGDVRGRIRRSRPHVGWWACSARLLRP